MNKNFKVRELENLAKKVGMVFVNQKGSHKVFRDPNLGLQVTMISHGNLVYECVAQTIINVCAFIAIKKNLKLSDCASGEVLDCMERNIESVKDNLIDLIPFAARKKLKERNFSLTI